MKTYQRNSILLLVGISVIAGGSLIYLLRVAATIQPQRTVLASHLTVTPSLASQNSELTQGRLRPCSASNAKRPGFQMGVAFPSWGTMAYGENDIKWLAGLSPMQTVTAACWVEMPVLFHQDSLTSTSVGQGSATTQISSFDYGVRFAHSLGLRVFVTAQLQSSGPQPWSGSIHFATYEQEQLWFESYWQALKPYAQVAEQDKVEQFAIGTEFVWLEQNAPASLWNTLIDELSTVFHGTLTYDMNWDSLQTPPPSWMRNKHLKMIGISAYSPLISSPQRVDPNQISGLWKQTVKPQLDNFSIALGEPIFLSEIGYPDSEYALYHPWDSSSTAPADPQEQAAACEAALANIIPDPRILGTFFWGWDNTGDFNLKSVQANTVVYTYYKSLQG